VFPEGAVALLERRQLAPGELRFGEVASANGRAALDSAETAIRAALDGHALAVVAAPHNETAIHAAGVAFDGYPGFVARTAGIPEDDVLLMLCFAHAGAECRIAHATLHTSVARALALLTRARVVQALRATDAALRRMGIARPRLAASGVNPHAGEGGLFGSEEIETIAPALADARGAGIDVDGPFGADTLLQRPGYDAFVVMLHDQGHVAAKLLAPNRAAGLAIGAPVLFSSVGHGSAFDIAGKGRADHAAMAAAITRLVGTPR
jgi:4-hydroxy-L-threonine phosphate dehydrogenase PdxA